MDDRKVYGVTQRVDAIAIENNEDLLDYVMKNMVEKLVSVAAGQAFDGEKIISVKDAPVEIDKYTNALIYTKHMYIEDLIRCSECKYSDDIPIADGRYWCKENCGYFQFCSEGERKEG